MGWWRIDSVAHGQINLADLTYTEHALLNRNGGRDPYENYYNGDRPADIAADAIDELAALLRVDLRDLSNRCQKEQIVRFFLWNHVTVPFERLRGNLEELRNITLSRLHGAYEEEWGRPAYPEELTASFMFVLNALFDDDRSAVGT